MKNGIKSVKRKTESATKEAKNLSLSPAVIRMGNALGKQDRRDFSAQVSWLIEQEHAKRFA
jgi:hypothetical protein